jgi:hypothetical protein
MLGTQKITKNILVLLLGLISLHVSYLFTVSERNMSLQGLIFFFTVIIFVAVIAMFLLNNGCGCFCYMTLSSSHTFFKILSAD